MPDPVPPGTPPAAAPVLYQAYLLRLWRDDRGAPWRASLEAPGGEALVRFGTVGALFAYLRDQLADPNPNSSPLRPGRRAAGP